MNGRSPGLFIWRCLNHRRGQALVVQHIQKKEKNVKTRTLKCAALAAALVLPSTPAIAAGPNTELAASVQVQTLPAAAAVASFYSARQNAPIWFKSGASTQAAHELVNILRRAQLDGMASGPMLASSAESAIARAASGDPAAVAEAERLLSSSWVLYVQTIRKPLSSLTYNEQWLKPRTPDPQLVLQEAAQAPSLAAHLQSVASVNPIYSELREAAWRQAQQSPGAANDARVLANLERARALPPTGRYVMVDAGSARLFMVDNGQIVDSMKVIVGKPDSRTPLVASTIYYATLNPYWHVPTDLAQRLIAPRVLKQGAGYLKSQRYEVVTSFDNGQVISPSSVDWKAVADGRATVNIRQLPGAGNSMGKVKFHFANREGVYLHDTPQKELFAKSQRTLSNGCIRLEDAQRLSRWLLGRTPALEDSAPEQHVQLAKGVPIYVTYLTAQPTGTGVAFGRDAYGFDSIGGAIVAAR
jgi:murein L,D-transpeptidase YcbB/YkuD